MEIWKKEVYGTGRCINCGFLGKRDIAELDERCFHASERDRECGSLDHHATFEGGVTKLDTVPWCFVNKASLHKEIENIGAKDESEQIFAIITKSRGCPSWYPWREFATPKEHFDESMVLAMEERREKFEQRLEKDRKEFDLKLFEISQKVQSDSGKVADRSNRFNRRVTWFFIVLALLGVAGTILTLAFPDGMPWLIGLFD